MSWLAYTFELSSRLRCRASSGAKSSELQSFLTAELQSFFTATSAMLPAEHSASKPSAHGWLELPLFLVYDAYLEGCDRSSSAVEPSHFQLHALAALAAAARRLLSLEPSTLHAYLGPFLRLRGSSKPNGRMPSWRWLASRAEHDPSELPLPGTERMRDLVERAVLHSAAASLAPLHAYTHRVRASLVAADKARA